MDATGKGGSGNDAPSNSGGRSGSAPDAAAISSDSGAGTDGDVASSGAPDGGGQPQSTLPSGRGAVMPFTEYEAESVGPQNINGTILGPTRDRASGSAAEASGRMAVRLDATGKSVQFKNKYASNSIVVRYSVPDAANGGYGADHSFTDWRGTLSVYVDGTFKKKLQVTSRYSWTYGSDENLYATVPDQNQPSQGNPHHYFDETRALLDDIPVGAVVMLRKDADDSASYYDIDLIDLEQVPPPLPKPAGYLSLTDDCQALPNVDTDQSAKIQACVTRAQNEKKGLYIPQGAFQSASNFIITAGVVIRGAGIWYSSIEGSFARFDCRSGGEYHDFAINGDTIQRDDSAQEWAFGNAEGDPPGSRPGSGLAGSIIENIWVEHMKVGVWTGPSSNNLQIRNCRFRDLFADGINLYGGSSNCVVENVHVRNSGDDAFAMWSQLPSQYNVVSGPDQNNVFRHLYAQVPWKANCFAIYGGESNRIEDSVCGDTVQYPGVLVAQDFGSYAFGGTTEVSRTTLIRAGGLAFGDEQGAFRIRSREGAVRGVAVKDLDIEDATYAGIMLQNENGNPITGVSFDGVHINSPGTHGIYLFYLVSGQATLSNVALTNPVKIPIFDNSQGLFTLTMGAGNTGF
jgi:hypothetical protein